MTRQEDRRTPARRRADRDRLNTQLDRLTNKARAREYQRGLFDRIRFSRANRGVNPVDRIERGDDFLVAVSGEVLVRTAHSESARAILHEQGFDHSEPVEELEGRVTRFTKDGGSLADAGAAVTALRAEDVPATVNYVVPLGYVAKGEGGFENTEVLGFDGPGGDPGSSVRVAVVDTGVAREKREDAWLQNLDLDDENVDPLYQAGSTELLDFAAGHGTFVAGVIQQICPTADIRVYRAVQTDGIGSELDIAAAVVRAAEDGAQIINLSLGTETADDEPPVGLAVALEILAGGDQVPLVVAAAGNSGTTQRMWPAAFPDVIGVGSITALGAPSAWSNHGPWVTCSAVGEGVVSTYVVGRESYDVDKDDPDTFGPSSWALGTGTSFAAPQIVGSVAQLMAGDGSLTPRSALSRLLDPAHGAVPITDYGMCVTVLPGT